MARRSPSSVLLVDALVQSAFSTMAVLSHFAAENDLSLTQLRVLAILRDRKVGVTALATYLGLEKSTLSGLVDRAEKRGLLERARDEADARNIHLTLSAAGRALANRVETQIGQALEPTIEKLTSTERERLQALLTKTVRGIDPL